MLALDGVFIEQPSGTLCFHASAPPTTDEVALLLATVRARVERWLERAGLLDDTALDALADEAPLLAHAYATSIGGQSRVIRGDLMRRSFGYDLLACPRCGGKMELLACILDTTTVRRILAHLGLPTELPHLAPARASPTHDL